MRRLIIASIVWIILPQPQAAAADAMSHAVEADPRVDVRAVGHTPDWTFELDRAGKMSFATDRADPVVLTTAPLPTDPPGAGGVIYGVRNEAQELIAEIASAGCTDAKSGQLLTHYVTIRLNGQEYRGCGTASGIPIR